MVPYYRYNNYGDTNNIICSMYKLIINIVVIALISFGSIRYQDGKILLSHISNLHFSGYGTQSHGVLSVGVLEVVEL